MSDTPRTDEAVGQTDYGRIGYVWASFAQKLERENTDLRAQLAAMDAEIAAMRPVIDTTARLAEIVSMRDKYDDLSEEEAALDIVLAFKDYESKVTK